MVHIICHSLLKEKTYLSKLLEDGEVRGTRGLKNRVVVRVLWLKVVVNEAKVGSTLVDLEVEFSTVVGVGVVDLEVKPPNNVLVVSGGFLLAGEAKVGTIEVVRTRPTIGSGCGNVLTGFVTG